MAFITLDFESYYGPGCSLQHLTYEQYLSHPEFHVHGVGIKINDQPVTYFDDSDTETALRKLFTPGNDHTLIAHNTLFDGLVLSWHYGLGAGTYYCTQAMARGLWNQASHSLENIAALLWPNDPTRRKGKELVQFYGIHRLSAAQQKIMGSYCKNDVTLTFDAFAEMWRMYPEEELQLLDLTLRMAIHPGFILNKPLVQEHLAKVQADKETAIAASGTNKTTLASGPKFVKYIKDTFGLDVPRVHSPTPKNPDNMKHTLSKSDLECIRFINQNPQVQAAFDGRFAVSSTQEESRAIRLLEHSQQVGHKPDGVIMLPLHYGKAHTLRWGGTNKINAQNFGRKSPLRRAITAPPGYKVGVGDLSQIEARMLAWWAGQNDLLEMFANKMDIYSIYATKIYGRPIDRKRVEIDPVTGEEFEPDKTEGFVGKVCLAADTRVITNRGIKRIVDVTTHDKLWDGIEWVPHSGLLYQGICDVMELAGVNITPTHEILCANQWKPAQSVAHDENTLSLALASAAENLPYPVTFAVNEAASKRSWSNVTADALNTLSTPVISKVLNQLVVMLAPKKQLAKNAFGFIAKQCPTTNTAPAYSTVCQHVLPVAITQRQRVSPVTADAVSPSATSGVKIAQHFSAIFKPSPDGITRVWRWIEQTTTKAMSLVTSVLSPRPQTLPTVEPSKDFSSVSTILNKKLPVYDLTNAGARHRFTILTNRGPLIVHNCVLGLGYQMGAAKFQDTLESGAMGPSVVLPFEQCHRIVHDVYRAENPAIVSAWGECNQIIQDMLTLPEGESYSWRHLTVERGRLRLPSGMYLNYPRMRWVQEEHERYGQMEYWQGDYFTKLYPGKLTENIIQALARIVIGHQMLKINAYLRTIDDTSRVLLTVHDEIVCLIPADRAEEIMPVILQMMCEPPAWCNDGRLVLHSEGGFDDCYSK